MKRSIILIALVVIIVVISFLIIQVLPEQKKDETPLNQSVESFSFKPMNIANYVVELEGRIAEQKEERKQPEEAFVKPRHIEPKEEIPEEVSEETYEEPTPEPNEEEFPIIKGTEPMNITTSILNREFRINAPQSASMIAWESVCSTDEDCKYAQNYGEGLCINFNHTNDPSYFDINEGISCVCKPLVIQIPPTEENITIWIEDQGSVICQIAEDKPDLAIQQFEVIPENPKVNDRVIYNTTIKNVGTAGCSMIDTIVNFGDGGSGWIKMSWCTHYGYTPQQCREMGYDPYFNPGEIVSASIDWIYNSIGTYNVTVIVMCFEPELGYSNNNANKIIQVSPE